MAAADRLAHSRRMSHDDNEKALTTTLEALKALSKWSPHIKTLDDAKAYLLQAFPAHDAAHKREQIELLAEIMRAATHGQRATVIELIKRLSHSRHAG
jgi:hypothetical protein